MSASLDDTALADQLAAFLAAQSAEDPDGLPFHPLRPEAIQALIARARGYGFAEPAQIAEFADLAARLGPDFDRSGETAGLTAPILDDPDLNPDQRLAALRQAALLWLVRQETGGGPGQPPGA